MSVCSTLLIAAAVGMERPPIVMIRKLEINVLLRSVSLVILNPRRPVSERSEFSSRLWRVEVSDQAMVDRNDWIYLQSGLWRQRGQAIASVASSRVVGIGPQIGYICPISEQHQGYINLKA